MFTDDKHEKTFKKLLLLPDPMFQTFFLKRTFIFSAFIELLQFTSTFDFVQE